MSEEEKKETPDTSSDSTKAGDDSTRDADTLGDAGKAALEAERKARKDAEKKARDLQAAIDKIDADKKKAAEDKAKEQGQFEALAETRERERDEAKAEASRASEALARYRAAIEQIVESEWKSLPEEVRDVYTGDDEPIAKLEFLPKAKKLAERFGGDSKPKGGGMRSDPKPGGEGAGSIDQEKAALRARGGYSM